MPRTAWLARSLAILFLCFPAAHAAHAADAAVPRFDTAEVVLRSARTYDGLSGTPNPFVDVQLTAQVTSPAGKSYTVRGFFDGDGLGGAAGDVFKLRLYLDVPGTWSWRTTSNDAGLNARAGTVSCSGVLAGVFGKGPVVRNPGFPRTLMHQLGSPVYLVGKFLDLAAPAPIQFSHTLLSEHLTEADRQALLDRHAGMGLNKMAVYIANKGDYAGVSTTPWVGTATANDKLRFDLARWRTFEGWVLKLRDAGMVAQLWYFADESQFGDLPDLDRKRLIQYAMARLSGYANTWFILALEWEEGWTEDEVAVYAQILHKHNPWDRMVSVMGLPGDFDFPTAEWADTLHVQVGNGVGHDVVRSNALHNRALAPKPLISEEFASGGETVANRQKAWTAFVSAIAGSGTGAFLRPLSQFAPRVPFHKMSPADHLVTAGAAYGMAQAGTAYVFYLYNGGAVSLNLGGTTGTFLVEWYDPRTGASQMAPSTTGGGTRGFTAPASGDWVLFLRR